MKKQRAKYWAVNIFLFMYLSATAATIGYIIDTDKGMVMLLPALLNFMVTAAGLVLLNTSPERTSGNSTGEDKNIIQITQNNTNGVRLPKTPDPEIDDRL